MSKKNTKSIKGKTKALPGDEERAPDMDMQTKADDVGAGDIDTDSAAPDTDTVPTDTTSDLSNGQTEPLGAQVLRRMAEHQSILLSEYDELMPLLENPKVKKYLQDYLENLQSGMEELEDMFDAEYPDLDKLEISDAGAENTEESDADTDTESEAPSGEEESEEGETDEKGDETEDVDADSGEDEEVPEEDVSEGMKTKDIKPGNEAAQNPNLGSEWSKVPGGVNDVGEEYKEGKPGGNWSKVPGVSTTIGQEYKQKGIKGGPGSGRKPGRTGSGKTTPYQREQSRTTAQSNRESRMDRDYAASQEARYGHKGTSVNGCEIGDEAKEKQEGSDWNAVPTSEGQFNMEKTDGVNVTNPGGNTTYKKIPGVKTKCPDNMGGDPSMRVRKDFASEEAAEGHTAPVGTPEWQAEEAAEGEHKDMGTCQCGDPGCPCQGQHKVVGSEPAAQIVINPQGVEVPMCPGCAADAQQFGFKLKDDEDMENVEMKSDGPDAYAAMDQEEKKVGEVYADSEMKALEKAVKRFGPLTKVKFISPVGTYRIKYLTDTQRATIRDAGMFCKELYFAPNVTDEQRVKAGHWHKAVDDELEEQDRKAMRAKDFTATEPKRTPFSAHGDMGWDSSSFNAHGDMGWTSGQLEKLAGAAKFLKDLSVSENLSSDQKSQALKYFKALELFTDVKDMDDDKKEEKSVGTVDPGEMGQKASELKVGDILSNGKAITECLQKNGNVMLKFHDGTRDILNGNTQVKLKQVINTKSLQGAFETQSKELDLLTKQLELIGSKL